VTRYQLIADGDHANQSGLGYRLPGYAHPGDEVPADRRRRPREPEWARLPPPGLRPSRSWSRCVPTPSATRHRCWDVERVS